MLFSRGENCVRTAGRIKMPLCKNFRRPQIFSLEISGPKVVLLCKFSLYCAVRAPVGARALRLQPHQPHGWSGPVPIWPILCWWDVKPYSINQSLATRPTSVFLYSKFQMITTVQGFDMIFCSRTRTTSLNVRRNNQSDSVRLPVCVSVRHIPVFRPHKWRYDRSVFSVR